MELRFQASLLGFLRCACMLNSVLLTAYFLAE